MRKTRVIATFGGGGIIGYFVAKLSSADLRHLLETLIDKFFGFLHDQGPYVAYALVMALLFGALFIWAIQQLIQGKQAEIDRLVSERDRFQKLFIEEWRSSRKDK